MRNEIRVASTTTQNNTTKCLSNAAKVADKKDICKVWRYFSLYVGTTLDAAHATGILRNSITYYVADLERMNMLQAIYKRPDRTTGYMAKYYSADKSKWVAIPENKQLSLFGEGEL